jgi:glycosyltransferase involved in cell wall biosynthesis
MRVGIFDPYLDDLGGGEKYMMSIAEYLSQKHKVDVFWDNLEDIKKIQGRFSLKLGKVRIVNNIFNPQVSTIKRLNKTREYDLLIILSDGSLPVSLARKTIIHFQQPFPNIKPNIKTTVKKFGVSRFFCNSKFTKSFVDKEFGINSDVLYPPVEMHAKKTKKENIILHVGKLRIIQGGDGDYKKQALMIDSFKQMVDAGLTGWKFILAVSVWDKDKDYLESMKKTAAYFPIEFLVNGSNDELWELYSRAKIYWHASGFGEDLENHPELAEHFGISTVEAMGAGAVPVVLNAGGQREIIKDKENGLLWNSINELQEKTMELIKNQKLMNNLSANALEEVKKYSKENFYKKIDELI